MVERTVTVLGGTLIFEDDENGETIPPPTPTGDELYKPESAMEFQSIVQQCLDEGMFAMFDPSVKLDIFEPMDFSLQPIGAPHGIIGNGMKLNWRGQGGQDVMTFRGRASSGVNTGLILDNFFVYGNGYDQAPAGACVKLYAPEGDPGAIYKFKLANIFTSYGTRGIVLEGAVFEGHMDNVHAENHRSHGMEFLHTNINESNRGIVSNISIVHPNLSRNFGAGLKCTYSTNLIYGSFVLNALGGVIAPDGLRYAAACNGENTGEAVFNLASEGYGSVITGCEASSDAKTVARAYENGQWVDKGKPELYLIAGPCDQTHNHVSYYGSGANPMRVQK